MKRQLLIILMSLLLFGLYGCGDSDRPAESAENKEILSIESDYNILLINTYLKNIQDASDGFYNEYFTISPRADYYVVSVKEISSDHSTNPTSLITFICEPFVGPHYPVGTDKISFSADYSGNIELEEFKHIKSYSLPDNLKSLIKKPIPGEYEPFDE